MASISDDTLLQARLSDTVALADKHAYPHFLGFLDERQRGVVTAWLRRFPQVNTLFFGGFADAERTLLGVFPSFMPVDTAVFPLAALTFTYRETAALSHRDFLGTFMSLGIRREKIGDILCFSGRTVTFVSEDIATFLTDTVQKVGGEGVSIQQGVCGEVCLERQYREIQATVASPRLDAVVKALCGSSRECAAADIVGGLVSLNHQPCQTVSKTVCENDVLSVRGVGRFRVVSLSARTKKDRVVLIAQKYI